jgi:hypothetical protein
MEGSGSGPDGDGIEDGDGMDRVEGEDGTEDGSKLNFRPRTGTDDACGMKDGGWK